jgi:tRNA(adenine34) deaminase
MHAWCQPGMQVAHDCVYMAAAVAEARKAAAAGEVPVGAVMVLRGDIIASAHNSTASTGDPTAHAEMACVQQASRQLGSWRLGDATLYCTLEPCVMCAGAMLQSRVGTLVYGARNALAGEPSHRCRRLMREDN